MKYHLSNRAVAALFTLFFACSAGAVDDSAAADTAPGYGVLAAGVAHERLFAIDFDGERGMAVGDLGRVMRTEDGGSTWEQEEPPTNLALLGVTLQGDRTIAVGQQGLILVADGGGGWRKIESGTTERLLNVDANPEGLAFIVGAFGTVLRSRDGGESWHSAKPDWDALSTAGGGMSGAQGNPTIAAVQVLGNNAVLLGGELSYIMRSPDAGEHWELVYDDSEIPSGQVQPTVNALHVRTDGVGFAVGQSGQMLKTIDEGRSWQRLDTPVDANLLDVVSRADGHVVGVGMRAAVSSDDNGETWQVLKGLDLALNWYSEIANSPTGAPIAVGYGAQIIKLPK